MNGSSGQCDPRPAISGSGANGLRAAVPTCGMPAIGLCPRAKAVTGLGAIGLPVRAAMYGYRATGLKLIFDDAGLS